jgi:hypothetical protein
MTSIVVGLSFIFLGFWGIFHWSKDFLAVLRGFLPFSVFIGGLIAVFAGLHSIQTPRRDEKSEEKS